MFRPPDVIAGPLDVRQNNRRFTFESASSRRHSGAKTRFTRRVRHLSIAGRKRCLDLRVCGRFDNGAKVIFEHRFWRRRELGAKTMLNHRSSRPLDAAAKTMFVHRVCRPLDGGARTTSNVLMSAGCEGRLPKFGDHSSLGEVELPSSAAGANRRRTPGNGAPRPRKRAAYLENWLPDPRERLAHFTNRLPEGRSARRTLRVGVPTLANGSRTLRNGFPTLAYGPRTLRNGFPRPGSAPRTLRNGFPTSASLRRTLRHGYPLRDRRRGVRPAVARCPSDHRPAVLDQPPRGARATTARCGATAARCSSDHREVPERPPRGAERPPRGARIPPRGAPAINQGSIQLRCCPSLTPTLSFRRNDNVQHSSLPAFRRRAKGDVRPSSPAALRTRGEDDLKPYRIPRPSNSPTRLNGEAQLSTSPTKPPRAQRVRRPSLEASLQPSPETGSLAQSSPSVRDALPNKTLLLTGAARRQQNAKALGGRCARS